MITKAKLKFIKGWHNSFTGRSGDKVEYHIAKLLDDEGNVFEVPCAKEFGTRAEDIAQADGEATLEFSMSAGYGSRRPEIKAKLLDFRPDGE